MPDTVGGWSRESQRGPVVRKSVGSLDGLRFDVAVVGGGINGTAIAQHLAAEGYSVVLVEKNDFASAASSRSSRVLHSGLRYLAPARSLWEHVFQPRRLVGRIRSAIESMTAMGHIVATAPERLEPMNLAMPIYRAMPYRGWQVDLGVKFLRIFNRHDVPLVYTRYHPGKDKMPAIYKWFRDREEIVDLVVFRDFQFYWPERFCVDAALDARRLGAEIRNYTTAGSITGSNGEWSLELFDTFNPSDKATVASDFLVNATGVWIDQLNQRGAREGVTPQRRVIAVKGVHIVVRLPQELAGEGLAALNRENEAIFALPWGDYHYIGPTETVYEGSIDKVIPEEGDIEFLINEANYLLPSLGLRREDVVFAWAGARPITYDPAYPKGRRLPFSVIHDLSSDGLQNAIALTWGTLNLHRVSARNAVKAVRRKIPPSGLRKTLNYAPAKFPESLNSSPVLSGDISVRLDDLRHAAENEDATNLVDLLFRRTPLGWRPDLDRADIHRAAEAVADILGWNADQIDKEVEFFADHMRRQHLVELR